MRLLFERPNAKCKTGEPRRGRHHHAPLLGAPGGSQLPHSGRPGKKEQGKSTEMQENMWARLRELHVRAQVTQPSHISSCISVFGLPFFDNLGNIYFASPHSASNHVVVHAIKQATLICG